MRKINRPGLDAIERFFGIPFADVINVLHHDQKKSIKWLSDQCGISRDTFQKQAKRLGLVLRPITESNKLTPNKGKNHWAYGLRKETDPWAKMHSDRMTANNPNTRDDVKAKRAMSVVEHLLSRMLPHEVRFAKLLDNAEVEYETQTPIGPYNLDFYFRDKNLCIEIDSEKIGHDKRARLKVRDAYLSKYGIRTIRIKRTQTRSLDFLRKFIASEILSRDSLQ